jgi:hypothetical protein
MITAFQRWAPPDVLGRLTGVLMLASFGVFPVSVAFAALVVHNLGAALFFPLAAAALAIAILASETSSGRSRTHGSRPARWHWGRARTAS